MATLAANTVASLLRDGATRAVTLDALEQHQAGTIDRAVSLAAAPVLYDLLAEDATEVVREDFDRIGLLVARLAAEALDNVSAVFAAAYGDGRYAAVLRSTGSVLAQALRKPTSELTQADARSFACSSAVWGPAVIQGLTEPLATAGFARTADFFTIMLSEDWFCK
jgi:hypothetical protein